MTNIGKGDAPCNGCGKHIWNIPLDLDSQESDGRGGYWYKVAEECKCLDCGEPFNWYHKPGPITIDVRQLAQTKRLTN